MPCRYPSTKGRELVDGEEMPDPVAELLGDAMFDPFIVNGRRTVMETCWLPRLNTAGVAILVEAMAKAVSPGCAIVTHEFKGAASRISPGERQIRRVVSSSRS
jgi:hypothetical protein